MKITTLGEPQFPSPIKHPISDKARVPAHVVHDPDAPPREQLEFELAGAREKLFFDPKQTRAGIVTCGGLCPGLNNVIRSVFLQLHYGYGVKEVLGFRSGYMGLDPSRGAEPLKLSPDLVHSIHRDGGTMLGTSRGPVDISAAVDNLIKLGVNILFTVGGDGTQRGACEFYKEASKRGHALSVVGIPKTIDNDVPYVSRTFGYLTAVEESCKVLACAHNEARSVKNCVSIVKIMGRHAGFLAVGATVASQDVNFTLIPEVPFKLEGERGFLAALLKRVKERSHAVVLVAEGAGQELMADAPPELDASGNVKLCNIGLFLRDKIEQHFAAAGVPLVTRYFDPSYMIRSVPADAEDAILCDLFARNAVHAGMAGKTGLIIGLMHDKFTHIPIELLSVKAKRVQADSMIWQAVLAMTGQQETFA